MIIAISDTHMLHDVLTERLLDLYEKYPDAIMIHAGDSLNRGTYDEGIEFLKWYNSLPFDDKIFVPGNHDITFDEGKKVPLSYSTRKITKEISKELAPSVTLVINDVIELKNGTVIGGISRIPDLPSWAFYTTKEEDERFFSVFPRVDILISHAPFDRHEEVTSRYSYEGITSAEEYVQRNNVKLFICGHIHEAYGSYTIDNVSYNVVSNTDQSIQ